MSFRTEIHRLFEGKSASQSTNMIKKLGGSFSGGIDRIVKYAEKSGFIKGSVVTAGALTLGALTILIKKMVEKNKKEGQEALAREGQEILQCLEEAAIEEQLNEETDENL